MKKKIIIVLSLILLVVGIKYFGLSEYLTFEYIKANQASFSQYFANNKLLTIGIYFGVYIITTALSIPGATILTLLGGAIFGLPLGLLIVSFASTLGATLAFLIARTLLRDSIQSKYGDKLKGINEGIEKEGAFYLFTLRLVPIFPFFLINLSMGLTKIKTITFFFVSQIGMLAGTAVYVNAGVQLAELDSLKGIVSPGLLGSFALLGVFPILAKKLVEGIKAKKVYKGFNKPKIYDYNMIAIGGGAGGLVTSYISAAVKAKVALVEREKMGGDCLNTGCVPSKAIIKSAKVAHQINTAKNYGIKVDSSQVDFKQVMNRVHDVIKGIEPHDSIERYTGLGVECFTNNAKILSPWEVQIGEKIYTSKNITIATGASPFVPPIKGIEDIDYLTSNNLWDLDTLPEKFVVLGGGPIGLEMAQSFSRLGSKVTVVEMGSRIMSREDEDVSIAVTKRLREEGITILTKHEAIEFIKGTENKLICKNTEGNITLEFDKVLIAVGRKPNTKNLWDEKLKIDLNKNGTVNTNDFLQTNYPNIFACGDVAGPYQLTHMAAHQAWYCAVNGLFGKFKKFKADYSVVPWCTYLDPEVATVGKNELVCKEEGLDYDVIKYDLDDLDRAIADSSDYGFVKVITKKGSDKILGATIVGANAGELIIEFVTSMKHGKGLNSILGTIHSYPTMAEGNKYAAGLWKQANKPEALLKWVEKFHKWGRS